MAPTSMKDLVGLGFPARLVQIWEERQGPSLLPLQVQVLESNQWRGGRSLLVIAPTSAGKTFVAEVAAAHRALARQRVLFLVPFRAIAEEHYLDFKKKYGPFGIEVLLSTGERRDADARMRRGDYDLAILTYEKLQGLLVQAPSILDGCGLVVIDELQMLADPIRGPRLELLLTKIQGREPRPQLIGLSAVLGELGGFDQWLDAEVIRSDHRPIPLREGIYAPGGDYVYRDNEAKTEGRETWSTWNPTEPDEAARTLAKALAEGGEQVLLFCSTVDRTIDFARALSEDCDPLPAAEACLTELAGLDETGIKPILQGCIARGIAFHNADMTAEERQLVESAFRAGHLRAVCSTSTLAAGVNLPARSVIIADSFAWRGGTKQPLEVATYRNMAGRSGRYRFADAFGRAVLLAPTPLDHEQLSRQCILGAPEPLRSQLAQASLEVQVLDVVASDLATSLDGITTLLADTFEGYHRWTSPEARAELRVSVAECLDELQAENCVTVDAAGTVACTRLGTLCVSKGFRSSSAKALLEGLRNHKPATLVDGLTLVTSVPEGVEGYRYRAPGAEFRSGAHLEARSEIPELEDIGEWAAKWKLPWPDYETYNRVRAILAGVGWMSGRGVRVLERATGRRAGALRSMGYQFSWVFAVMGEIASGMLDDSETAERLFALSERARYGVPDEGLELMRHEITSVGRERVMRLVEAGISSVGAILDAEPGKFRGILEGSVATQMRKDLEERIASRLERKRREHRRRMEAVAGDSVLLDKLYQMDGEALEIVVQDVLRSGCCPFPVERIAKQNEGEPDLLMRLPSGTGVISVTAKRDNRGQVSMKKAVEIIGTAARFRPSAYFVIGRPEFDALAVATAKEHVAAGQHFKLLPISALAEVFVAFSERRLSKEEVEKLLLRKQAHLVDSDILGG